jgi:hypothetical protein
MSWQRPFWENFNQPRSSSGPPPTTNNQQPDESGSDQATPSRRAVSTSARKTANCKDKVAKKAKGEKWRYQQTEGVDSPTATLMFDDDGYDLESIDSFMPSPSIRRQPRIVDSDSTDDDTEYTEYTNTDNTETAHNASPIHRQAQKQSSVIVIDETPEKQCLCEHCPVHNALRTPRRQQISGKGGEPVTIGRTNDRRTTLATPADRRRLDSRQRGQHQEQVSGNAGGHRQREAPQVRGGNGAQPLGPMESVTMIPQQQDRAQQQLPRRRRNRVHWTEQEFAALSNGMQRYGTAWSRILADVAFADILRNRTANDLKDKARIERKARERRGYALDIFAIVSGKGSDGAKPR